jgi:hypothetical protein
MKSRSQTAAPYIQERLKVRSAEVTQLEDSILEAPDDDTVAELALTIGSAGAIRTETLRAWPDPEPGSPIG